MRPSPRCVAAHLLAVLLFTPLAASAEPICAPADVLPDNFFPSVEFETTLGNFVVELNRLRAPMTSNNFLKLVLDGHYDGTIFHRVVAGFVVQAGGYTETFEARPETPPLFNESGNGLKNLPMTISMARFDDPHSASSQFFVNLAANESLDPGSRSWGYAVFGQVVSGQDVAEAIGRVAVGYRSELDSSEVPVNAVVIKRARVVGQP